jgi:chaperonin GroEL
MVYRPDVDPSLVFVIMPFSDPFNGYYEKLIKPVVQELERRSIRSDEMYGTGAIVADIWTQIWRAVAVVADVTGRNPNVNYELGLCHALGVPTVLMTRNIDDVPFDYRHRRCIVYDTNQAGWETQFKTGLRNTLQSIFGSTGESSSELSWPYDTRAARQWQSGKRFVDGSEGLRGIVAGAMAVSDLLARAYGPAGLKISIRDEHGRQRSSRRGPVLAKEIQATHAIEAIGVQEMKRVVTDMESAVGDGTKTAALIASEMLSRAVTALRSPIARDALVRGMDRAVQAALGALESQAKPVVGVQLALVGKTAAKDDAVGTVMAEAYERVGKYGIVTIEPGPSAPRATVDVSQGIQLDRGFVSELFVTDTRTAECVLDEPVILLSEFRLTSMKEFLPVLEEVARVGKQLLILADSVEGEALAALTLNHQKGTLRACAIRAPGHADRRRQVLEDLAVLTGGFAFTAAAGRLPESVRLSDLGSARTARVNSSQTTIIEGKGRQSDIEDRVHYISAELGRTNDAYGREKLQERLAMIAGAVAVIRPGGMTPSESDDRMEVYANAMYACRAAIQDGWVVGGGWAEAYAAHAVRTLEALDEPDRVAHECVTAALESPLMHLPGKFASPSDLISRAEQLSSDGVLDSTSLVSRSLAIAWSHVKEVIQTGVWDISDLEPPAESELGQKG